MQIRNTSDAVVFTVPTNGGSITSMGDTGQPSGDTVWQVDFTPFNTAGAYRLYVPAWNQQSYDFMQNQKTEKQIAPSRSSLKDLSVYEEVGDLTAVSDHMESLMRISVAFFSLLFVVLQVAAEACWFLRSYVECRARE